MTGSRKAVDGATQQLCYTGTLTMRLTLEYPSSWCTKVKVVVVVVVTVWWW